MLLTVSCNCFTWLGLLGTSDWVRGSQPIYQGPAGGWGGGQPEDLPPDPSLVCQIWFLLAGPGSFLHLTLLIQNQPASVSIDCAQRQGLPTPVPRGQANTVSHSSSAVNDLMSMWPKTMVAFYRWTCFAWDFLLLRHQHVAQDRDTSPVWLKACVSEEQFELKSKSFLLLLYFKGKTFIDQKTLFLCSRPLTKVIV